METRWSPRCVACVVAWYALLGCGAVRPAASQTATTPQREVLQAVQALEQAVGHPVQTTWASATGLV